MKLKCVYSIEKSSSPAFIVGKEYDVYNKEKDNYYVMTENGTCIDVVLNGYVWKFETVEDSKDKIDEKEDILFEIESLINQLNNEFNKLKKLI